jgi:regulator of extracellular matrix RemA (YlzA/DUF370 family)
MGDYVNPARVLAVLGADSLPTRRLVWAAKAEGLLVDATHRRRSRGVLLMDNGRVILSMLNPETIAARVKGEPS